MHLELKKIYKPSDIDQLLSNEFKFIKNNKKLEYLNIPISFDIETSSFYNSNNEKQAIMYAWVFGVNGKCIIGRTWDEFLLILKRINEYYQLNANKRIIIWIHNLSFEFAFMQHLFKWDNVFAIDERKPVYAICGGIEFRCSYILSGYSLDNVAKNLAYHKINKLNGNLDYSLIRHSLTPLTDKEYQYILYDGLIVMAYIDELLMEYGDFHKLPLTQTGFVRKYVRTECLYGGNKSHKKKGTASAYAKYHGLIKALTIPTYPTYKQMKRVYAGGFTHCNGLYSGVTIDNVTSYDFASSYPAVMVMEKYPMSTPQLIELTSIDEFYKYLKTHCCMFDIKFYNIKPKLYQEHPLSASKCCMLENHIEDNGRIVSADSLVTSINEVDFKVLNDFYKWDYMDIWNFRIMLKGYLPTPFIKSILKLYELKTSLKGLDNIDDLIRYMKSKQHINALYGMCVTDILQFNRIYKNGKWITEDPDIESVFKKYNKSKSRFIYYPWGIWVTSYSRFNLFCGIKAVGNDYIYSDTDSMKIRNADKHIEWINNYNEIVKYKLHKAMDHHKLDYSMCEPKTIKGEVKTLGVWEFDGDYKHFKSLGAKRYIYEDTKGFHLTCSGVSKSAINYIIDKANESGKSVFDIFSNNLIIPKNATGKNIHTYIDDKMCGYVTDYLGNTSSYNELSGVHLESSEYHLSLSKNYINYLSGINQLH